jgi:hypothetical protein
MRIRVGVAALPLRQGSLSSPAALSRGGSTRSGRRKEQGRSGTRRPPTRGGAGRSARRIWSRSKEELRRWPPSSTRAPTATASAFGVDLPDRGGAVAPGGGGPPNAASAPSRRQARSATVLPSFASLRRLRPSFASGHRPLDPSIRGSQLPGSLRDGLQRTAGDPPLLPHKIPLSPWRKTGVWGCRLATLLEMV